MRPARSPWTRRPRGRHASRGTSQPAPVSPRIAQGCLALIVVLGATVAVGSSGAVAGAPAYVPPVDGTIVEPFRQPQSPYSAGNRGIDYQTAYGAPVRASGSGTVVWAGPVAGALHVTVLHPDGLRSSYSFLSGIKVTAGQPVDQGEVLGWSSGQIHFGFRDGDQYLDPALLISQPRDSYRLIPSGRPEQPVSLLALEEREHLLSTVGERGWSSARIGEGLFGPLGQRLNPLLHEAREVLPSTRFSSVARRLAGWWRAREACTPEGVSPPPPTQRRVAVLVGGLGSSSRRAAVDRVDIEGIGYQPSDVVRFSYAGGRVPAGRAISPALESLPASSYEPADTFGDLMVAAARLRALLEEIAEREPGVPIDVIAHSQGGVVAHLALTLASQEQPPPDVDLVVTLGSPHGGADLATAAAAVAAGTRGRLALSAIRAWVDLPVDPLAPAVAQLSETSELRGLLEAVGAPEGVSVRTISARGDLTVPAGQSRLAGAVGHTVELAGPAAHSGLPASAATTREIALAVAGMAPTCETLTDAITDIVVSEGISWAQDLVGIGSARAVR